MHFQGSHSKEDSRLAVLTLPLQNFLLGDPPALPGDTPMNCTSNIPVALLVLHFSLNV